LAAGANRADDIEQEEYLGSQDDPRQAARTEWRAFAHRVWITVLIVTAVGGAILLFSLAYKIALIFFASVLLAIFLRTLTDWMSRLTHLGSTWSLTFVLVGLVAFFGLIGWVLVTPISQEAAELSRELPRALQHLQTGIEQYAWGKAFLTKFHEPAGLFSQAGTLLGKARDVFSITAESVIYIWVILFCGFYLTTQPHYYVEGFLRLIPAARRARGRAVLYHIGHGLRSWLFGQIISMSIIGFFTWLGLFLLGIPLSAVLGLVAGILDFVPVVGPWVAGILSCLLALLISPLHAVYVACLFVALHFLEGHILVPQIQKHASRLPPVLTVLAMVLFASLFGLLGLFLATPLLALVLMVTEALYIEDVVETTPPKTRQTPAPNI